MGQGLFFAFAANQLVKAYYPFGIIARSSIKVSPAQKVAWFAPMLTFFGYMAWATKERPRWHRPDYSDASEE